MSPQGQTNNVDENESTTKIAAIDEEDIIFNSDRAEGAIIENDNNMKTVQLTESHNGGTGEGIINVVDETNTLKNAGYSIRWCRLQKVVQLKSDGVRPTSIGADSRKSMFLSKSIRPETTTTVAATAAATSSSSNQRQQQPTSKEILKGISGSAMPGEILALMGPSGSGKTSLLNVLSGRSPYQNGIVSINGQVKTKNKMKRLMSQIAYVKQADIFFEHLTIRDQFTYTALLRLPDTMTLQEKLDKVETTIQELRLTKVADSPIRLCSGGEKKRVNIGSEILTNPAVIMLDEPTSGLDSSSAVSLIQLLSSFAKVHGKTVITSIHQPSSAVFRSFDRLLMLSEGHVVYFGTPVESITYLKSQNLTCPDGYNAADHWMDVLVNESSVDYTDAGTSADNDGVGNDSVVVANLSARQRLELAWDDNAVAEELEAQLSATTHDTEMNDTVHSGTQHQKVTSTTDNNNNKKESKYNTSWTTQYYILTHRAFKNSRSAIFTPLNLIKSVALGFVSGLLWFQNDYTESNVEDIRSYYFFTMTFWVFDAMFTALTAFPSERTVILKERSSGSYHLSAYFLAKTTADAPVRVLLPLLYMIISFWMAGISNSFVTFIGSVGCTLLSVLSGEAIGLFIGASVYDLQKGITIMTVFTLFLMLLGGFFVKNIPSFLAWAKYISPFKYAFDSSLQIVFDQPVPCDGSGSFQDICAGGVGTYASVEQVKEFFNIQGSIGFNVGLLLVLCTLPRYFAYWALRAKKEGER